MNTYEEDGIVYFKEPTELDWGEFLYSHLGCDFIVQKPKSGGMRKWIFIAYATAEENNDKLERVFDVNYASGEYRHYRGIDKYALSAVEFL